MSWFAQAPSNIALIKYMGKKNEKDNIADNPSLSYTLNHLLSSVTLEVYAGKTDFWEPLYIPGADPFTLSLPAQARFLKHLKLLKDFFNYDGSFIVRSSNNFPTGCGLASSASSFAALTLCAVRALCELQQIAVPTVEEQAQLSRLGSGSSCRSFFAPWVLWDADSVKAIELPYPELQHQVILISQDEKQVLSREAHQRVKTSPLYATRNARATENLKLLLDALTLKNWPLAYQVCWNEFQDIHHLFETSDPPFSYMTSASKDLLDKLQLFWEKKGDGPIVSMDAGSNIHLLYRPDQKDLAQEFKADYIIGEHDVL